ncbi:MAG: alpha/beta hydrolase [Pseudomonadota bacterium]
MKIEHPRVGDTAREVVGKPILVPLENDGRLVVHQIGHSKQSRAEVLMFASLGRESSDFNELATALSENRFAVSLIEAPFINGAVPSRDAPSLFDLAEDVGAYLSTCTQPVFVIGHAFGNRLARAVASTYPDLVAGVILIAAGGLKPIDPKAVDALLNCFNDDLSLEEHQSAVRFGFFAKDNSIPDYWLRGWHKQTADIQSRATRVVRPEDWWGAGGKPMLVIAATNDTIAPPRDTIDVLEREYSGRVSTVRIMDAGHALLPEKPREIAAAILTWLNKAQD